MNDKEKIQKALKEIKELEEYWDTFLVSDAYRTRTNPNVRAIILQVIQIKKTLEE